jgi:hypothetical protein
MSTAPLRSTTPAIDIYVKLAQFPILCDRIRLRMREELFRRGIITQTRFEQEVKELAVESQRREGLTDPRSQEDENTWQRRLDAIRDLHTDFMFAHNLGSTLLDQLIEEERHRLPNTNEETVSTELTFNPEIAPWALLFRQGEIYDNLPPREKEKVQHHLAEIKVVLIKRLMSDHLSFISLAKNVFSIQDLRWIYDRLIGRGKIGGKASSMLLALKMLENVGGSGFNLQPFVDIPDTIFIGSELIYEFLYLNRLEKYVNQKYLPFAEMQLQYPQIVAACREGRIPVYLLDQLHDVLLRMNGRPYIIRSSGLLEDHLDYSFAGKYASYLCANQGSTNDNLEDLLMGIRMVYASTFNPEAMVERQKQGLIDYDERMAVMIQPLVGEQYGSYFFPAVVGTGLSENPVYLETHTRREDGCLRLVCGFADRVESANFMHNGCFVALSHPQRRLSRSSKTGPLPPPIQDQIKVINLETNEFELLPQTAVLDASYPWLKLVTTPGRKPDTYQITFENLTHDETFVKLMRHVLKRLHGAYGKPVELEFTVEIKNTPAGLVYHLYILQCYTAVPLNR